MRPWKYLLPIVMMAASIVGAQEAPRPVSVAGMQSEKKTESKFEESFNRHAYDILTKEPRPGDRSYAAAFAAVDRAEGLDAHVFFPHEQSNSVARDLMGRIMGDTIKDIWPLLQKADAVVDRTNKSINEGIDRIVKVDDDKYDLNLNFSVSSDFGIEQRFRVGNMWLRHDIYVGKTGIAVPMKLGTHADVHTGVYYNYAQGLQIGIAGVIHLGHDR